MTDVLRKLAFLLIDKQDPRAIDVSLRLVTLDGDGRAWNFWGLALGNSGKFDLSVGAFKSALELNPERPGLHCNLGRALKSRGDFADAIIAYRNGLAAHQRNPASTPNRTDAVRNLHNGLAWVLATAPDEQLRVPDEAVTLATRVVNQSPSPNSLNTLGVAQYRNGDYSEAIETLQGAMDFTSSKLFYAMALHQQGQHDDARNWLEEAEKEIQAMPDEEKSEELLRFLKEARETLRGS